MALRCRFWVTECLGESTTEKKEVMDLKGKKVLVAYFSWSGNTKYAAQYIAKKVGADEFEIIREKPYSTEYTPCTEEAKAEKEAGERPSRRHLHRHQGAERSGNG